LASGTASQERLFELLDQYEDKLTITLLRVENEKERAKKERETERAEKEKERAEKERAEGELRARNMDYLALRGTVDVRGALGECFV
jgi:uncharacterized protein (DUF3084 family)